MFASRDGRPTQAFLQGRTGPRALSGRESKVPPPGAAEGPGGDRTTMELDRIIITGARQHNLKNITVEIPKKKLVILTGVSGSGIGNPERPESWGSSCAPCRESARPAAHPHFPIVPGNVALRDQRPRHLPNTGDRRRRTARRTRRQRARRSPSRPKGRNGSPRGMSAPMGNAYWAVPSPSARSSVRNLVRLRRVDLAHEKRVGDFARALISRMVLQPPCTTSPMAGSRWRLQKWRWPHRHRRQMPRPDRDRSPAGRLRRGPGPRSRLRCLREKRYGRGGRGARQGSRHSRAFPSPHAPAATSVGARRRRSTPRARAGFRWPICAPPMKTGCRATWATAGVKA